MKDISQIENFSFRPKIETRFLQTLSTLNSQNSPNKGSKFETHNLSMRAELMTERNKDNSIDLITNEFRKNALSRNSSMAFEI